MKNVIVLFFLLQNPCDLRERQILSLFKENNNKLQMQKSASMNAKNL